MEALGFAGDPFRRWDKNIFLEAASALTSTYFV